MTRLTDGALDRLDTWAKRMHSARGTDVRRLIAEVREHRATHAITPPVSVPFDCSGDAVYRIRCAARRAADRVRAEGEAFSARALEFARRGAQEMKLEIVRRRWARGNDGAYLHDTLTHKQCCLGFYARALGIPLVDIRGRVGPCSVDSDKWPTWLVHRGYGTAAEDRLIHINDDPTITDEEREEEIRREFAKHGVRVVYR